MNVSRRDALLRPYAAEHARSLGRAGDRGREPRSLGEYLVWMGRLWREEMPDEIHTMRPFFGPPDRGRSTLAAQTLLCTNRSREHLEQGHQSVCWRSIDPTELVGGSLLGSPDLGDAFRRLMENGPFETEHAQLDGHDSLDEHFVRPLHAAIALLAHRWPVTARWLASLAACDFDWQALGTRRGWTHEETELYLEKACHLLWDRFREAPDDRGRRIA